MHCVFEGVVKQIVMMQGYGQCVLVQHGITPVVLGTGMTKVHTTEEILKIENLNNIAELAFQLLTAE